MTTALDAMFSPDEIAAVRAALVNDLEEQFASSAFTGYLSDNNDDPIIVDGEVDFEKLARAALGALIVGRVAEPAEMEPPRSEG